MTLDELQEAVAKRLDGFVSVGRKEGMVWVQFEDHVGRMIFNSRTGPPTPDQVVTHMEEWVKHRDRG